MNQLLTVIYTHSHFAYELPTSSRWPSVSRRCNEEVGVRYAPSSKRRTSLCTREKPDVADPT